MKNKEQYKYVFSVVMAVYNCEPFLRETLDSIVNQDIESIRRYVDGKPTDEPIPFEELVQVIMVDDGSKDGSGAICDEYAEKYPNFKAVHKPNGGVASARNEGLLHVEGKYMNFLDSDDTFSKNVFAAVYPFFEENYDKTDVVTMPLIFFDAFTAPHWQNYKFKKYARVARLFHEYDCPLMFVNASFFKSEYKDTVKFDGRLVCGEDIRYISEILSHKMTMGLVPYCHYGYRRRSSGEESLIQTSKKKVGWYFDYFTHLVDWGVNFCREKWGFIPAYFQNIFVCDIKWRFLNEYEKTALELLGEAEYERYKSVLYNSLKYFDDKYFLEQRGIWNEHKCLMLQKKHGCMPQKCVYDDDVALMFDNTRLCWLSGVYTMVDFVRIKGGFLEIEGYANMIGIADEEPITVGIRLKDEATGDEEILPCEAVSRDVGRTRLDETLLRALPFRIKIPLERLSSARLNIVCIWDGNVIVKKDIRFGNFSTVGKEYKSAYYYSDGYLVTASGHTVNVKKCSSRMLKKHKKAFYKELRKSGKTHNKKAYLVLKILGLLKRFKRKKIWLISDRIDMAGDNGEAFFKYASENKPKGVTPYFVISKESADYDRLKKIGKVLDFQSHKHKLYHLLSDAVVSSHADSFILDPFSGFSAPYRAILAEKKFVFLQHGVTEKDGSLWFNRYKINAAAFITSSEREREAILDESYGYGSESVWLTGMPRYDNLSSDKKKVISVVLTWRAYLLGGSGYTAVSSDKFLSSKYFCFLDELLGNERLRAALSEYGYELRFKPHPRMLAYLEHFENNGNFKLYTGEDSYNDIFKNSALLVTDYSSVAFDFAYLKKPIVYCQFDKREFFDGEHTVKAGYFDYERDGFGEVAYDSESTVDLIIDYIKNDCRMKDSYIERVDGFFAFDDKNNSKRVAEKLVEICDDSEGSR